MRLPALLLIVLATVSAAQADAVFKAGVTSRDFIPAEPYDWRGAKTHALRTTIWYPATADAREEAQWVGPPIIPFYSAGRAARDAAPADGSPRPLILVSHGNGGTASGLAWLGSALAAQGFIVAAVEHPGNNAREDYTVEGLSLWWLRAVDLSAVIDALLSDKTLGSRIDPTRIGAVGHSLGGYTVLTIAGGIANPAQLEAFCRSSAADATCTPPGPAAEARQANLARLSTDPDYRQRYERAGNSYRDERVHAVFAMAPGPGPILTPESLAKISIPIAIVSGTADEVVPPASAAESYARLIPHATLKLFRHAGHFAFVGVCTMVGRWVLRTACYDPDGADREAVHAETARLAIEFFTVNLR